MAWLTASKAKVLQSCGYPQDERSDDAILFAERTIEHFTNRTWAEADIRPEVVKAAALYAAYYLGLSDSEASRYIKATRADISFTNRSSNTPVPEAETLLYRYVIGSIGGDLV
jgi:hypothetical protein